MVGRAFYWTVEKERAGHPQGMKLLLALRDSWKNPKPQDGERQVTELGDEIEIIEKPEEIKNDEEV